MSEMNENVVNEETQENVKAEESKELVIEEDSLGKKILKGVVKGLALVATGVAGFFLGRASKGSDNDSDDAEAEGPKDE